MTKSIELDGCLQRVNLIVPFQEPILDGTTKHSALLPFGGFKAYHSRIFISGPVSNKPNHNKEQFTEAEEFLRTLGFWVWNPHHVPTPDIPLEEDEVWQYYMHFCVCAIAHCDSMLMLPNWQNSKGAVKEHRLAEMLGLAVYYSPVI